MKRLDFYKKYFPEERVIIFNPLFWHLSKWLNDPDIRYIFLRGGSSAAKTYTAMQCISIEGYINKYDSIVMRKYGTTVDKSIYKDFKNFNKKLLNQSTERLGGMFSDIDIIRRQIRSKRHSIDFGGLDDPDKIKGIADYVKVLLDELDAFKYADFDEVERRLRGQSGQQIICTWNPVSENIWVKKKVIDSQSWYDLPKDIEDIPNSKLSENSHVKINKAGDAVEIKTTYLDNYWIVGHDKGGFHDKHAINKFERMKVNDPNNYKIYALGEYGVSTEGQAFTENINWTTYSELPDYDFYETYGLDFAGGSSSDKRKTYPEWFKFDEADGSTTTVLTRLMINKASMSCYIKLLIYKEYIDSNELIEASRDYTVSIDENGDKVKKNILADNARGDKITEMLMQGLSVIGAKTSEGGSNQVKTGVDIMKKYKLFVHIDDVPAIVSLRNHKKEISKTTGMFTGNYMEEYKDFIDSVRYALVYYDLFGW